ncbi:rhamnan synthesis F family protein [Stappia sp.]|uniref:rhamnan synthesis F family protein n=1 Tax=Stappia sp. TaxID=1870903 RepID=UPI003A9A5879
MNQPAFVGTIAYVARRALWLAWYNLQLIFIVYPAEGFWRVTALLNPRTWSYRRRVRAKLEGSVSHHGGTYAVFAMFREGELSPYTLSAIDSLNRLKVNIILVSNTVLTEAVQEKLRSRCRYVVIRDNIGRDFGAYKDGFSVLRETKEEIQRLVLLNDSVVYLLDGLDEMFRQFLGDNDYAGLTEVHDRHYHVQSFLMSFGASVLRDPRFLNYWRRYIPIGTRRWSIHKGEVGLTRMMLDCGFRPKLVASLERLKVALENDEKTDNIPALLPDRFAPAAYQSTNPVPYVLSVFGEKNQIHVGAFLLTRYAISPLFKRDIVARGVYSPERLKDISGILGLDLPMLLQQQEIHQRRRHTSWISRILFRFGSI